MACNNHNGLKENGGRRFDNGVFGKLSSSSSLSCNGSTKQSEKVDLVGPGNPETVKIVTAVTANVGGEKSSKGSNVKSSRGKLRRRGSGKNSIGTLDQAIRQRNIFTAVAKMPAEIQTTFMENGWIGKITVADNCFRRRGEYLSIEYRYL